METANDTRPATAPVPAMDVSASSASIITTTNPNLYMQAPTLSASFSSVTTASASSLTSSNGGGGTSSSTTAEDRRLHNMPKALASKCVEAFIAWGHDHKGNPKAYQEFLRKNLPDYPGIDGEKVRLYMKNICATYHERYVPAKARGYTHDFLVWWDKRPGRGRPKKDVRVSTAYALPHHLNPELSAAAGLAATKPQRRRKPTKRVKANAAMALATARASSSHAHAAAMRARRAGTGSDDDSSANDNEVYYYGSDFDSHGASDSSEDDLEEEFTFARRQYKKANGGAKKKGAVRGVSKSGRAIRRPSDPYMAALQEEALKRTRIEAALAMMEMDTSNGATGRGPPPRNVRTPSPHMFRSKYHGTVVYPVNTRGGQHHGIRIESPVPLNDHEVTAILTDLRTNRVTTEDTKMPAAATMATAGLMSPRLVPRAAAPTPALAPRPAASGPPPARHHPSPPSVHSPQALAGLVTLSGRGGARVGRPSSPANRLQAAGTPVPGHHPYQYMLQAHPHPRGAANGAVYLASAAAPPPPPTEYLHVVPGGPPPGHPQYRPHHQMHGAPMHGVPPPPHAYHHPQYNYHPHPPQGRSCHEPNCTVCVAHGPPHHHQRR